MPINDSISTMHKNTIQRNYEPDYAVPPGATLLETIDSLGIDQRELAERTGLSAKTLNLIIHGKAPLTQQTAMLLERVTSVPARMWNNLEANYQEQLARLQARRDLAEQIEWLKTIPTKVLIDRGFIQPSRDKVVLLEQILNFFRVAHVDAWKEGWGRGQFAFRKSEQASAVDGRLATWLQIAELQAEQMNVETYDKTNLLAAMQRARSLTRQSPQVFLCKLASLFQASGVAFCTVPEIPGAKISGAAKWLSPTKAMIAVNLRGKKSDLFWFTLFHEVGHILNDSKKEAYVDVTYSDDPRERFANDFARTTLIPAKHLGRLASLKTEKLIREFADEIEVDPGIVVGRLQYEKLVRFDQFNHLKTTFQWAG